MSTGYTYRHCGANGPKTPVPWLGSSRSSGLTALSEGRIQLKGDGSQKNQYTDKRHDKGQDGCSEHLTSILTS